MLDLDIGIFDIITLVIAKTTKNSEIFGWLSNFLLAVIYRINSDQLTSSNLVTSHDYFML